MWEHWAEIPAVLHKKTEMNVVQSKAFPHAHLTRCQEETLPFEVKRGEAMTN